MATLESIQAKIAKLQAQAETLAATKSTAVLEKIRDLMHKHGLTLGDIEAHVGKRRGRKPGSAAAKKSGPAAKYQDPKSGATWSGYGRAPGWIAGAKDRTKFLIDGGAKTVAPVKKAAAKKAGNYARGPQPALYRDPASGATWSGRGPAPAWLAGAKDRTKFLIAKPEGAAAKTAKAAAPAKKAAAQKTVAGKVAKKTTAKKAVAKKAVAKKAAARKAPVAKKAAVNAAPATAGNTAPAGAETGAAAPAA